MEKNEKRERAARPTHQYKGPLVQVDLPKRKGGGAIHFRPGALMLFAPEELAELKKLRPDVFRCLRELPGPKRPAKQEGKPAVPGPPESLTSEAPKTDAGRKSDRKPKAEDAPTPPALLASNADNAPPR